jgi:hypothetical protein
VGPIAAEPSRKTCRADDQRAHMGTAREVLRGYPHAGSPTTAIQSIDGFAPGSSVCSSLRSGMMTGWHRQDPVSFVVMHDPEGNEFCVG